MQEITNLSKEIAEELGFTEPYQLHVIQVKFFATDEREVQTGFYNEWDELAVSYCDSLTSKNQPHLGREFAKIPMKLALLGVDTVYTEVEEMLSGISRDRLLFNKGKQLLDLVDRYES